jgi:hypothetical protein
MSTLVYLTLEYEPEGVVEQVGDKLGIVERQVTSDLEKFKALIEDEGYATGAWRGSVNEGLGVGTPGVEAAAASRGDSGKAGVSAKTVAAGAAAAVAGVAAAAGAAAAATSKSGQEEQQTEEVSQPQKVAVVPQPPEGTIRDDVLLEESPPEGYQASPSTEGVEKGVTDTGDDPMIGGGSR